MAKQRPGRLTAVCVIAAVLGALGIFSSLVGIGSLLGEDLVSKQFREISTGPALGTAENQLIQKMEEVRARWKAARWVGVSFNLVFSAALLLGGTLGLRPRSLHRSLLLWALGGSIPVDLFLAITAVLVQLETIPILREQLLKTAPPGGGAALQGAEIGLLVGLVFSVSITACKLAYYIFGIVYLNRPKIKAWYGAGVTPGTA